VRKESFDHVIAAAVEISGEREIVVIGSQAILGSVEEPPESESGAHRPMPGAA
jgi:hypothetical protein